MDKKDKGLELACRFSLITNRLRYCGPKDAYLEFEKFLRGENADREKIKSSLIRYEGLYVYLRYMAEKLGKDIFDHDIIEAYWLGNSLLENFTLEDLKKIILLLVERGLPSQHAQYLSESLPPGLNPHHSFNVLFVGVGMTTGSVPTNIMTMNKCILSIGKVLKCLEKTLIVSVSPLILRDGVLAYGDAEIQHVDYTREFLPIKAGDYVAIHWDYACKRLTDEEKNNLDKYTQQNIDALNQALFFSNVPKTQ